MVVIEGRGRGHGVGMAQDGAYWMARSGANTERILQQFYPGTTIGRSDRDVRVAVGEAPEGRVELHLPDGGTIEGGTNRLDVPSLGKVEVWLEGDRLRAGRIGEPIQRAIDGGTHLRVVPADHGVIAVPGRNRRYRGVLDVTTTGTTLRLVNELDVEQYLQGMGEVRDPHWPPAALRAQAIVARTYAVRAMDAGRELCDDDHCQVYLGRQAENEATDRAVADTRHEVVLFEGHPAATVYSANGGGVSATGEEGFGGAGAPYLVSNPYPTRDPARWVVRMDYVELSRRLNYPGRAAGADVVGAGPSGRVLQVRLTGSAGDRLVDGRRFASELGLPSTLFRLDADNAGQASGVPPGGASLQRLPDDTSPVSEPVVSQPGVSAVVLAVGARSARAPHGSQRLFMMMLGVALATAGGTALRELRAQETRRAGRFCAPISSSPPSRNAAPATPT